MPQISLERITLENWEEAIALKVRADQERFVASNLRSIAESKVRPQCNPVVIRANRVAIGFFLWARDGDLQTYWIYRFMIDAAHQGMGLGRAALEEIIPFLAAKPGARQVMLAVMAGNDTAERLYRSVGFVHTGRTVGDESVMILPLPARALT